MDGLYIGLMSGTSVDAIDTVIVEQGPEHQQILGCISTPWPKPLQQRIRQLSQPGTNEIDQMGALDAGIGKCFAQTINKLLAQQGLSAKDIIAIGSHGQTIRHRPNASQPFTLQIGDPNIIAALTGITVVADFRRRDMAYDGQGAPLAPAYHHHQFGSVNENRVILNLGGIANISILALQGEQSVIGFDTGPANTLLDYWVHRHLRQTYDLDGQWASQGNACQALLDNMLSDVYFDQLPPKSTGPEHFSSDWLDHQLSNYPDLTPQDIQSTLIQLTVKSIGQAIRANAPDTERVIACGGGVHNKNLMTTLATELAGVALENTSNHGVDPDFVEAAAFAWLAYRTMNHSPGNLPSVTGASCSTILGGIYLA